MFLTTADKKRCVCKQCNSSVLRLPFVSSAHLVPRVGEFNDTNKNACYWVTASTNLCRLVLNVFYHLHIGLPITPLKFTFLHPPSFNTIFRFRLAIFHNFFPPIKTVFIYCTTYMYYVSSPSQPY